MSLTTGSGWSINSGFGSVITYRTETDRTVQHAYSNPGGSGTPRMWQRQYHTSNNGGGWTAWSQVQLMYTLTPGTLVQTSAFTAYPAGWSRIYFTTANNTGWDFSAFSGELLTYVEGSDFAKQTFTSHASGANFWPEIWTRTANAANGWSAWRKMINDQNAWGTYTPTWTTQTGLNSPSLGNATVNCRYYRVGRMVTVHFNIVFGSTTNFGAAPTASDNWQFSLPSGLPAVRTNDDGIGFLEMYQNATNCGWARVKLYSTTGIRLGVSPGSTASIGGDVDSISPFTWASGNSLKGTFTYETAS